MSVWKCDPERREERKKTRREEEQKNDDEVLEAGRGRSG